MKKYVLDTNFIIALLDIDNPFYEEALSRFFRIHRTKNNITIPYIVLAEVAVGMENPELAIEQCLKFSDNFEPTQKKDINFFKNIDSNKRKSLRAPDCMILAMCHRLKAKLITFDEKLECIVDEVLNP